MPPVPSLGLPDESKPTVAPPPPAPFLFVLPPFTLDALPPVPPPLTLDVTYDAPPPVPPVAAVVSFAPSTFVPLVPAVPALVQFVALHEVPL